MEYSPKLRRLANQIREMVEDENVTMLLCLHDHEHQASEWVSLLELPDNAVKVTEGESLQISTVNVQSKKKRLKLLSNTANMLKHFQNYLGRMFMQIDTPMKKLEQRFDITDHGSQYFKKGHNDN